MSEGKQRMAVEVRRQHVAVELGKAGNTGLMSVRGVMVKTVMVNTVMRAAGRSLLAAGLR